MQNGVYHHPAKKSSKAYSDITLAYILQILNRRKLTLLWSVLAMLALALVYNYSQTPVYEAVTLLKKAPGERKPDNLDRIIRQPSAEDISTEMQILQSRSVLKKVIEELKLAVVIEAINPPNASARKCRLPLAAYQAQISKTVPTPFTPAVDFSDIQVSERYEERMLFLEVTDEGRLELYDYADDLLLAAEKNRPGAKFTLPGLQFSVNFAAVQAGSQVVFRIQDPNLLLLKLAESISVNGLKNTDLFTVTVRYPSAYMSQLIANTLVEQFQETVLENNRQSASYSFDFVNRQLEDISAKLKQAEAELSDFKRDHNIANLDGVSGEMIESLSNLEAERIRTELELAENRNRYTALANELKQKGYFDQTFLTPGSGERNAPFASLLEQLSRAEVERLELLQKRTARHPDVQAVDIRIQELKHKLSQFNQNTITTYQILIGALEKKQADLQSLVGKYEYRLRTLPAFETRLVNLSRQKNVYEKMFVMLLDKREEMRMAVLSTLPNIVIVDPADLPRIPVAPRGLRNLLLGLLLGVFNGLGIIVLQEMQSKTFRNLSEIEDVHQVPFLAVLPRYDKAVRHQIAEAFTIDSHIAMLTDPQYGIKGAYQMLHTKLAHLHHGKKTVLLSSCEENSGKTTVSTNFAVFLAAQGCRVLLVECDLHKPKIAKFFRLPLDTPGLVDFFQQEIIPEPAICNYSIEVGNRKINLDVVPAGGVMEDTNGLWQSEMFKSWLENMAFYYDYIILDTPPLTRKTDVFILGSLIRDLILVINPALTVRDGLLYALQNLKQFNINVLGCVANACDIDTLPDRYRYGYGLGYAQYGAKKKSVGSNK